MSGKKAAKAVTGKGGSKERLTFHLMMLPGMIMLLIFCFYPAGRFPDGVPGLHSAKGLFGSKWVGWENFEIIFSFPDSVQVFWNTLIIAFAKLVFNTVVPVLFSILLN